MRLIISEEKCGQYERHIRFEGEALVGALLQRIRF